MFTFRRTIRPNESGQAVVFTAEYVCIALAGAAFCNIAAHSGLEYAATLAALQSFSAFAKCCAPNSSIASWCEK
jgi:hypothetical protein